VGDNFRIGRVIRYIVELNVEVLCRPPVHPRITGILIGWSCAIGFHKLDEVELV
jgi:hypothetical protein